MTLAERRANVLNAAVDQHRRTSRELAVDPPERAGCRGARPARAPSRSRGACRTAGATRCSTRSCPNRRASATGTTSYGCEVQTTRGHTWPDRLGYHAGAEIAFTAQARRWFADRAAARELALYLRWSKNHRNAPTTGITVTRSDAETTYSLRSTTGKRFAVTVRNGRVVRENVRPYAGPL